MQYLHNNLLEILIVNTPTIRSIRQYSGILQHWQIPRPSKETSKEFAPPTTDRDIQFSRCKKTTAFVNNTNAVNGFSLPLHVTGTSYLIKNDSPSLLRTRRYHSGPLSPSIDRDIPLTKDNPTADHQLIDSSLIRLHTTRPPLTPPTIMAPALQDNPNQDDDEDVPITNLFPSFDQALATFLHDSFDVPKESHSTLCEALITSQYRTWSDFLFIEDIDDLTYQDGGARVPLTRHVQLKLQRFVDFGRRLTEQGLDWEECDHYTKEAFKEYWSGIVKASRDSTANR
eukprot:jgi/Psemu1/60987/gm1.60987_g